jgi:hypothetical protein
VLHSSSFKEWDDVRLKAARSGVLDAIENQGVHKFLVLNVDQVWRQSLRFRDKILIKGGSRQLAALLFVLGIFGI